MAKAGAGAIIASGWIKPIIFIVISPMLGMALGLGLTVALSWALRKQSPGPMDKLFRRLQLISAALYSLSHGANDAQKTMGIIVGLLVATQALFSGADRVASDLYLPNADEIPMWVILSCAHGDRARDRMGGWRIVKTMGTRITKLRPFGGFCAETGGGISVLLASSAWGPGQHHAHHHRRDRRRRAADRMSAVRWGVAGTIVWAWILTIPMSAAIAALTYLAIR